MSGVPFRGWAGRMARPVNEQFTLPAYTGPEANCKGVETEIFFESENWGIAATYCRNCPLLMECRREFAHDEWAYAGGMTPGQRRGWRREQRVVKSQPKPRNGRPSISNEQIKLMLEMFDSGLVGVKTIAREAGVSKSSAQRILKQHGRFRTTEELLELAREGGRNHGGRPKSDTTRNMVIKLVEERTATGRKAYTAAQIAEMVGVTTGYVYEIRSKYKRGIYKSPAN